MWKKRGYNLTVNFIIYNVHIENTHKSEKLDISLKKQ